MTPPNPAWADAVTAATLFAVDPAGTGGVALRAPAGAVRDAWFAAFRAALPAGLPLRRMPVQMDDSRLLGGIDLSATLRAGHPVAARGLLAEADGGVVVLAMAERLSPATAARLSATLDSGEVATARDGLTFTSPARIGLVACDEGIDDEAPPAALLDRLAFRCDLGAIAPRAAIAAAPDAAAIAAARIRLPHVTVDDEILTALCATAEALGVASLRAVLLALAVARAAAALAGRDAVEEADAITAGRLVLAPRATTLPEGPPPEEQAEPPPEPEPPADSDDDDSPPPDIAELAEIILEAARAAIPAGLLEGLRAAALRAPAGPQAGRAGAPQTSRLRGRPFGTRRAAPRSGARLNLIETLRAAAPWQRIRRAETGQARIQLRPDDFHITRFRQRSETTTVFVVDASGSQALNRLAEAKGAAERLLADCYVRRDRVAVLAFRGSAADLLLPPTRSLVRAKRSLAGLPGGGGTPLATGIDAAVALAEAIRRQGGTPALVLLTDGQGNIARDGTPGRARAQADATAAARRLRPFASILIDTSPRPRPAGQSLAAEMGARYLPLPYADPALLSRAVQATGARA
jgi:magnesium chelatase subunit D